MTTATAVVEDTAASPTEIFQGGVIYEGFVVYQMPSNIGSISSNDLMSWIYDMSRLTGHHLISCLSNSKLGLKVSDKAPSHELALIRGILKRHEYKLRSKYQFA